MATTDVPGELLAASASKTPPQRSTWGLFQLSLFWIATNFHWAAIPLIILPSQVRVLLFQHHPPDCQARRWQTMCATPRRGRWRWWWGRAS